MSSSTNYRPSSTWSPQQDETLIAARAKGLNWQPIAQQFFPSKTPNACRKRHERLIERRNAEDWNEIRLETLAKAYMDVRKDMWSMLADRVDEKWQMVEAKCMEKGIKNLNAAARSAMRREQGIDEHDSGIGMEEAEYELEPVHEETTGGFHGYYPGAAQALVGPSYHQGGPSIASLLSPPNALQ